MSKIITSRKYIKQIRLKTENSDSFNNKILLELFIYIIQLRLCSFTIMVCLMMAKLYQFCPYFFSKLKITY